MNKWQLLTIAGGLAIIIYLLVDPIMLPHYWAAQEYQWQVDYLKTLGLIGVTAIATTIIALYLKGKA